MFSALYVGRLPPPMHRSIHIVYGKQKDKCDVMSRQNANDHVLKTLWERVVFGGVGPQKKKNAQHTNTNTRTPRNTNIIVAIVYEINKYYHWALWSSCPLWLTELIWISSNPEWLGQIVCCGGTRRRVGWLAGEQAGGWLGWHERVNQRAVAVLIGGSLMVSVWPTTSTTTTSLPHPFPCPSPCPCPS